MLTPETLKELLRNIYKAGYLKGAEVEKERQFKEWQKVYMQYKQHIEGLSYSERMAALGALAILKEQLLSSEDKNDQKD